MKEEKIQDLSIMGASEKLAFCANAYSTVMQNQHSAFHKQATVFRTNRSNILI